LLKATTMAPLTLPAMLALKSGEAFMFTAAATFSLVVLLRGFKTVK